MSEAIQHPSPQPEKKAGASPNLVINTSLANKSNNIMTPCYVPLRVKGIRSAPPSPVRSSSKESLKKISTQLGNKPLETFLPDKVVTSITERNSKRQSLPSTKVIRPSVAVTEPPRRRSVSDVVIQVSRLPKPAPGSPASRALKKANTIKVEHQSFMQKRIRFGRKKLGRKKYNKPKGNEIHAQHEQYALTYGMMSGILNSVGAQNQFKQQLTMNDFMKVDKRVFPAKGKLQHPFKFKDYSPDIFKQIRRRFNIDSADYMLTLCGDFNYIEFISNSKSGQFFFYSHDGRFMIKTQTKAESKFLRRIMPHYYKHVMENPNTLITRFYGMHRVKMHHLRRKMHFVIMASVFDTPKEIHHRFDLKGSKIGREASDEERRNNGVLKDMDIINGDIKVSLGPAKRAMLMEQIRKDVAFLKKMKIMDYSMLLGVHDSTKATTCDKQPQKRNSYAEYYDNVSESSSRVSSSLGDDIPPAASDNTVEDIQEDLRSRLERAQSVPEPRRSLFLSESTENMFFHENHEDTSGGSDDEDENTTTAAALPVISPRYLDAEQLPMPAESVFCEEEGGMHGRTVSNKPNQQTYFIGIIDILQQYNSRKIAETFLKGMRHNRKQISAVNPNFYGDRFIDFMDKNVLINAPDNAEDQ